MFIMNNALIMFTSISFAFHNYRNYVMVFLVIFEISLIEISTTIFPIVRARP